MSATNRTNVRKPYDFYSTPIDCIKTLLDNIDLTKNTVNISLGNAIFRDIKPNIYRYS